jgi:hypothetical protein
MARGGRGYEAVPAGDEHTPRRAEGLGSDTADDAAEHDRVQLTSGTVSSDHVDSETEVESAHDQQPAAVVATASQPQGERVDVKDQHESERGAGAMWSCGLSC